jgi:integrase
LNPGSPAPQASVLIQFRHTTAKTPTNDQAEDMLTRLRAHTKGLPHESLIIATLVKMKNDGLAYNTIDVISHKLNQITKADVNLLNTEEVRTYISDSKISNAGKQKLANAYQYFAKTHSLPYEKPHYKWERKIPLIPTTANVDKIISACSKKYSTIYTILKETGLETRELETTHRTDIDTERGVISAQGCKGHNSRTIKLCPKTADLLRAYLDKNKGDKPFPTAQTMGEQWRRNRNRLADKLNEPQLRQIPLRNLRHYFATRTYDRTKDILLVKQLLGHKKIETTMLYTQLVNFNEEEEYTCKTATNIKEATELLEHGFQYIQDIDGIKLYRKRK